MVSMKHPLPAGIIPYLPTPVTSSGTLDNNALHRLVDALAEAGVSGLSPLGSTGELPSISDAVADDVVENVVDYAGELPVVPGMLSGTTTNAATRVATITALGASGIVAMIRPWGKVSQASMTEYFNAMATATDLPLVLYRQPSLGAQPDLNTLIELSKVPNIYALKDASPNTGFLMSLTTAGSELELYSASSHVQMLVWELGGRGWMGGPCCIAPRSSVAMWNYYQAGDRDSAWRLQRGLWPLCRAFAAFGPAPMVKGGLALTGLDVGTPFAPLESLNSSQVQTVRDAIDAARQARADLGLDTAVL